MCTLCAQSKLSILEKNFERRKKKPNFLISPVQKRSDASKSSAAEGPRARRTMVREAVLERPFSDDGGQMPLLYCVQSMQCLGPNFVCAISADY